LIENNPMNKKNPLIGDKKEEEKKDEKKEEKKGEK
jgi:hypothetical protein